MDVESALCLTAAGSQGPKLPNSVIEINTNVLQNWSCIPQTWRYYARCLCEASYRLNNTGCPKIPYTDRVK